MTNVAYSANTTSDGVNSLDLNLNGYNGSGELIGEADAYRSSKADYDDDDFSSSNTKPAGVYVQNVPGMCPPDVFITGSEFVNQHATLVAQQMIGTGLYSGVSPKALLHSIAIDDISDDVRVALALNRLATDNGGLVRSINLSFYVPAQFHEPEVLSIVVFWDFVRRRPA
jgi:hypothetical protein